jgi:hypothetical protein
MTKNVDAIRRLLSALNSRVGNLPTMPRIYPDYPAPIIRNVADGELTHIEMQSIIIGGRQPGPRPRLPPHRSAVWVVGLLEPPKAVRCIVCRRRRLSTSARAAECKSNAQNGFTDAGPEAALLSGYCLQVDAMGILNSSSPVEVLLVYDLGFFSPDAVSTFGLAIKSTLAAIQRMKLPCSRAASLMHSWPTRSLPGAACQLEEVSGH